MAYNIGSHGDVFDRHGSRTNDKVDTMGNIRTFRNGRYENTGYVKDNDRYDNSGNWRGHVSSDKRREKY